MKNINLSKNEILARIGYFRNKKNISAYKLGLELGHSKTYFYRVESGEIALTIDTFLEILDILQITTTEFFCPDVAQLDEYKEFFDLLNSFSKEEQKSILTFLKLKNK